MTRIVIPAPDSVEVVRRRFRAWSGEWRESRYPPSMRALGHAAWPLVELDDSRYRYHVHLGWGINVYDGVLEITLTEHNGAAALICSPRLSPTPRTVIALSAALSTGAVLWGVFRSGWSIEAIWYLLGGAGVISLALLAERPFAMTRLNARLPRIEALLREVVALDPGATTP